ncbi:hypothetical protein Nm8I071_48990 [Nonomuraea sp. TT08I-71]|nr:hypothetical protein Nm8I071_48990 [Nonomuraea sp. TT08I-71]
MPSAAAPPRFPRSSPYWPVVSHPLLRRVIDAVTLAVLALTYRRATPTVGGRLRRGPLRPAWPASASSATTGPCAACWG